MIFQFQPSKREIKNTSRNLESESFAFLNKVLIQNGRVKESYLYLYQFLAESHILTKVDVDNFLKLLFDSFKGYVFVDDAQIFYVMADKNLHPANMMGFLGDTRA
jgi:hypothetical protein